ncbi:hypothetical protein BC936DRAFT_143550, partial [Jimgerdemannia flammicorona]
RLGSQQFRQTGCRGCGGGEESGTLSAKGKRKLQASHLFPWTWYKVLALLWWYVMGLLMQRSAYMKKRWQSKQSKHQLLSRFMKSWLCDVLNHHQGSAEFHSSKTAPNSTTLDVLAHNQHRHQTAPSSRFFNPCGAKGSWKTLCSASSTRTKKARGRRDRGPPTRELSTSILADEVRMDIVPAVYLESSRSTQTDMCPNHLSFTASEYHYFKSTRAPPPSHPSRATVSSTCFSTFPFQALSTIVFHEWSAFVSSLPSPLSGPVIPDLRRDEDYDDLIHVHALVAKTPECDAFFAQMEQDVVKELRARMGE